MYPNEYIFRSMVEANPNLEVIQFYNNTVTYGGVTVNLENLNLQEIYGEYSQLKNDIASMDPKDLFKIIQVNAAIKDNEKKKAMDLEENIEQVKKVSPTIKNMNIITKKNELGTERQYVHFVTEDGMDHVLYNHTPQDVMEALKRLTEKNNGNNGVTEDDLYNELKTSMNEIHLVDSHDVMNSYKYSEDFEAKMKNMEAGYHGTDYVLGNEEHDIYLAGHQATTYTTNDTGLIQKEKHDGASIEDGSLTSDGMQSQDELVDSVEKIDITNLISVEEYIQITSKAQELNLDEQQKVDFFQGFIFELKTYKDYLVNDGLIMLNKYENYIAALALNEQLNNNQENALNNYNETLDKIPNIELKNAKNKALILEYKAKVANQEKMAGYANSFLVIEVTFVLAMTLSALIIYFFW